jgi:hypothetical protein
MPPSEKVCEWCHEIHHDEFPLSAFNKGNLINAVLDYQSRNGGEWTVELLEKAWEWLGANGHLEIYPIRRGHPMARLYPPPMPEGLKKCLMNF